MTALENGSTPGGDASALTREEAQRRLEEILGQGERDEKGAQSRRTRAILVVVLIVLLLLLCGVGAFLYRLLSPGGGGGDGAQDDLAGIIWIRSIYGFGPSAEQMFVNPNDAATDPDGIIWVTDPGASRVVGFRGDGTYADIILGSMQTGEPFRLPSRVAVDPDGVIYIVDRANETLTIMDGQRKLAAASIPGVTSVDANDEIVVAGAASGFAILDKDGNIQTIVGTRGTNEDQFDSVGGVAIDSDKKTIYVADTYNNRLSAWDYTGKRKWMVTLGNPANAVKLEGGASLTTTTSAEANLQLPTDVTIDGNGRPMILDAFDFSISAFGPSDGKFLGKWGTHGEKDGQFMYPTGFSYDASKDWFVVADTENLRAEIIRIEGTGASGAAGLLTGLNRLLAGPLRALWPCLALLPLILLAILLARRRRRRQERESGQTAGQFDGTVAAEG